MTHSIVVNAVATCTQTSQLVKLVLTFLLTLGKKLASEALDFEGVLSDDCVLIVAVAHYRTRINDSRFNH